MLYNKKWDGKLPLKTAEELGLKPKEYNALVQTLALFENGQVPKHLFDMSRIGRPSCGTPGCILGWAQAVVPGAFMGNDWQPWAFMLNDYFPDNKTAGEICHLFSPIHRWARPEHAAMALRNYLTTGHADWHGIRGME